MFYEDASGLDLEGYPDTYCECGCDNQFTDGYESTSKTIGYYCPPIGVPLPTPNSYWRYGWVCPKCGRAVSPDLTVCPYCSTGNGWYDPFPTHFEPTCVSLSGQTSNIEVTSDGTTYTYVSSVGWGINNEN